MEANRRRCVLPCARPNVTTPDDAYLSQALPTKQILGAQTVELEEDTAPPPSYTPLDLDPEVRIASPPPPPPAAIVAPVPTPANPTPAAAPASTNYPPPPPSHEYPGQPRMATFTQAPGPFAVVPTAAPPTTSLRELRDQSRVVQCEHCGQTSLTKIDFISGYRVRYVPLPSVFPLRNALLACTDSLEKKIGSYRLLAVITCIVFCPLVFVPYMMNDLKDVEHRCGRCGTLVAKWERGSRRVETYQEVV